MLNLSSDHSFHLNAFAAQRNTALAWLEILDTPPEQEFEAAVRIAQRLLGCKIALISLIDKHRQWFKAKAGLAASETPIDQSFCAHAVAADEMLVVPDALADPRFASNPLVLGPPFIRFYAGMPIHARIDHQTPAIAIGTLCVIDEQPRSLSANEAKNLRDVAELVETIIHARRTTAMVEKFAKEREAHIQRLNRRQRQFHQAARMANIGSWRLSFADLSVEWSNQVFVIHDLPVGDAPNLEHALEFYPSHSRAMVAATIERSIATGQPFDFETDLMTAKGMLKRVRSMGEIEIADGRPVALVGVFQDITKQYRMEQDLRRSAHIDELTQIGNRACCNQTIEDKIAQASEQGGPLALLLIDLDGFKLVNDRCGHLAGDELLRLIGAKLQSPYLSNCFVGRLGGDEFIILVSSKDDCERLDHIIRALLADLRHSVVYANGIVTVSGSIGVAWFDDSVRDRSDLLLRADKALYEAKREKPGSAQTFDGQEFAGENATFGLAQLQIAV